MDITDPGLQHIADTRLKQSGNGAKDFGSTVLASAPIRHFRIVNSNGRHNRLLLHFASTQK